VADTYLQATKGGQFSRGELYRVATDIYDAGFSPCYIEILELYQARGYVIVALYYENDLWGLIAAYQNSGPRQWKTEEINLLVQVSNQLGSALQQAEYLKAVQQAAVREKTVNQIANRIRKVFDLNKVFKTTTQDVRHYLQCDRVGIYQFNDDWSGAFIAESVTGGWIPLVTNQSTHAEPAENVSDCTVQELAKADLLTQDTYLQQTQGGAYRQGAPYRVQHDIYKAGFSPCYIEVLEQYQARAYMIVPIYQNRELWGLLAAYQNSGPRQWEQVSIDFMVQIGAQLGVALQQVEFIDQIQQQSDQLNAIAKRTLAYNTLINRLGQLIIQQSKYESPVEKLMKVATVEIRRLLDTDRVAFYKFNPDWSGEFILEDVGNQWMPLVGGDRAQVEDTYLQDHQGGRYRHNESLRVTDIYAEGYDDCHVNLLEQWGVKAYMLTPIFVGDRLWGILGVYHNRSTRQWQDYELDLLIQVGVQISIALQQSESAAILRQQSQELAESAARDKADKDALQQRIMQMLVAVRPALDGDLTVRAPVTEDAVGTIADAYNNTIQALRQLVAQVKAAAHQVSQTSEGSQSAVAKMTAQTERELEEINQALIQIQSMVDSTRSVADSAKQVEVAVQQANKVVQSGNQAMNLTVGGIQQIRDTVAETSKKIKRLGESSQKISKVVSLISNFTTQTNLLAINAAIEATRAGEYGRGFAVVADEVRSLAQQSDDATTEIEQLVQDIQTEVSAVSSAMDTGIQEVVRGTDLVNQTRQSLADIVQATAQISELVEGITNATQTQKLQSESAIQIINRVTETAQQTSAESAKISASFQNLLATSQTLQSNVDRFRVD
jgi:methyl-accepting chemotaxis protein PixJ